MNSIMIGTHLPNKQSLLYQRDNIDFTKNIRYLKSLIAIDLDCPVDVLELVYKGKSLNDNIAEISMILRPNDTIHCFHKLIRYYLGEPYDSKRYEKFFYATSVLVADKDTRCNILYNIFTMYPELEDREGLVALLCDAVLNNTQYQPNVVKLIARQYQIFGIIGPHIADYIKKESAKFEGRYFSDDESDDEEEHMRKISRQQLVNACRKIDQIKLYENTEFTQRPNPLKILSIVIKNLKSSTETVSVKLALQILGHNVQRIHYLDSILTGTLKRNFYIDLEPDVNNQEIFKVKTLLRQNVKIELKRQREVDLLRDGERT